MPYPMIHMEIACRLLDKLTWIEAPGDFILGSAAPDSVHFRQGYEVRMKEASHLWNCGPRWGMTTESEKWKQNIIQFWETHKNDENRDFYAGYCVHILTDWLNDLRIWSPFRDGMEGGSDVEMYVRYYEEAHGIDQWLYHTSGNTEKIWMLLEKGVGRTIAGCALAEDIKRQQSSLLTEQFASKAAPDVQGYYYCTEKVIRSFIEECVEEIPKEIGIRSAGHMQ